MAAKINFTRALLNNMALPEKGKRTTLYDAKSRGLCLIATVTGVKSFYVLRKVKGKTERVFLGRYPDTSIEQARKRAGETNSKLDGGTNPNDIKRRRRQELTLDELFKEYMERHIEPHRRRPDNTRIHYRYLQKLGNKKISDISQNDVRKLHAKLASDISPTTANKAHTLIRSIFNKAIQWGMHTGLNPANGVQRFKEQSRDRFLLPEELPAFLDALKAEANETIRDFILILLMTGARRREAQAMRWADIDFELQTWRIPETKNGEPRAVVLVPEAISILKHRQGDADSAFVFPGSGKSGHLEEPKKAWKRILERAQIENLRIHDLRRTFGSWLTVTGANMQVVGKALGHKDINSTAIYARLHLDPVRQAANVAVGALFKDAKGLIPEQPSS